MFKAGVDARLSLGVRMTVLSELRSRALQAERSKGPARPSKGGFRAPGAKLTTADVVLEIIKPDTSILKCAFVDTVPAGNKGQATVYATRAWDETFADVVAQLEEVVGEDDFVWFPAIVQNVHDMDSQCR